MQVTPEEQPFWDAAYIAGLQDAVYARYLADYADSPGIRLTHGQLAEHIANEAVEQRRRCMAESAAINT